MRALLFDFAYSAFRSSVSSNIPTYINPFLSIISRMMLFVRCASSSVNDWERSRVVRWALSLLFWELDGDLYRSSPFSWTCYFILQCHLSNICRSNIQKLEKSRLWAHDPNGAIRMQRSNLVQRTIIIILNVRKHWLVHMYRHG